MACQQPTLFYFGPPQRNILFYCLIVMLRIDIDEIQLFVFKMNNSLLRRLSNYL